MTRTLPQLSEGSLLVVAGPSQAHFYRVDERRSLLRPVLGLRRPNHKPSAKPNPQRLQAFVREVARYLALTLSREGLVDWILVAPVGFSDELCDQLDLHLLGSLSATVERDYQHLSIVELWSSVVEHLPAGGRTRPQESLSKTD